MNHHSARGMSKRRKGFTMIELLVVIVVTTIGFIALLNLQIGTLRGLANARNQQGALILADHVGQTMRMEAMQWTPTSSALATFTSFRFLKNAPTTLTEGATSGWLIAYKKPGLTDIRVGVVGNDGDPKGYDTGVFKEVGDAVNAHYCVHYRLTWIIPDLLLRADVRIMWPRDRANFTAYRQCPVGMEQRLEDINQVTVPITLIRNVFVKQVT